MALYFVNRLWVLFASLALRCVSAHRRERQTVPTKTVLSSARMLASQFLESGHAMQA